MAGKLGSLTIDIAADVAKLRRDMERADRTVRQSTDKIARGAQKATRALGALAGIFVTGQFASKLVESARQFDVINASLITATGSAENAAKAFEGIADFAANTPFQVNEVADAFIRLKNLGLDPSEAALESYGNTASAMGRSLNQVIEAAADAVTGEFERLKEFGIRASSEGDRVTFTFRGISTEIGKNAAEIERYLRDIGDIEFGGAMAERAKTLDGALSSLQDSFDGLFRQATQDGGAQDLADSVRELSELLQDPNTVASVQALSSALITGFGTAVQAVNNLRFALGLVNSDTLGGVQKQIEEVEAALEGGVLGVGRRIRFFGEDGLVDYKNEDELRAILDELIEKRDQLLNPPETPQSQVTDALGQFSGGPSVSSFSSDYESVVAENEKIIEDLRKADQKRLESIRQSLLSEEEATRESYERRREFILSTTEATEAQRVDLLGRLDAEYAASLVEAENVRIEAIRQSLLTREQAVLESYQREREFVLNATQITEEQRAELLRKLRSNVDDELLQEVEVKAKRVQSNIQRNAESQAEAFDRIFGQGALTQLFSDLDNIEDRFKSLLANIAAQSLASGIMNIFNGGSFGAGVGEFFGGLFGGARAMGGPVEAGKFYKVGERGQEYFAPSTDGIIIPNGGMGGGSVSVTMNINGGDADSFMRSSGQISKRLMRDVRSAGRNA